MVADSALSDTPLPIWKSSEAKHTTNQITMSQVVIENPIINSPFDEPSRGTA